MVLDNFIFLLPLRFFFCVPGSVQKRSIHVQRNRATCSVAEWYVAFALLCFRGALLIVLMPNVCEGQATLLGTVDDFSELHNNNDSASGSLANGGKVKRAVRRDAQQKFRLSVGLRCVYLT